MVKEVFESKSFAVIGASREPDKVGHVVFKNLIDKGIKAYPINPNANEILGKKCYKSILEISEIIDCAIIVIPAQIVISAINDIIKKKIKNIVIISAGFSEAGNHKLEEEVKLICEKNKINLIGPNSLGFINPHNNVNASFFKGNVKSGKIAFLSQSGAIGSAVLDKNLGFSGFISVGNSCSLDFSDFIEHFSSDKNTDVICIYMESLKKDKGSRFIQVCQNCKKPIIILKAGKTSLGERAASSHTAALASVKGVYEGIFAQCKIIEVPSIKEMFQLANLFIRVKKLGKKALVITNAGGLGVLISDYIEEKNLELPRLPMQVISKLDKILPLCWSKNNPIDVLGDAEADRYEKVLNEIAKENFYDFIIILFTPQYMSQPIKTAEVIINSNINKPIITCFMGGKSIKEANEKIKEKITCFSDLKEMMDVIGKATERE